MAAAGAIFAAAAVGTWYMVPTRPHGLPAGRAVVLFGESANRIPLSSVDTFDADHERWLSSPPDDPLRSTCGAGVLRLQDGRILVVGGGGDEKNGCMDTDTTTNGVRVLDLAVARWETPPCQPGCVHTSDGRTFKFVAKGRPWLESPCSSVGPCPMYGRSRFPFVLLPDGRALALGGCSGGCAGPNRLGQAISRDVHWLPDGGTAELARVPELYDPAERSWAPGEPAIAPVRASGVAVVAGNYVLVCGGNDGVGPPNGQPLFTSCEVFDHNHVHGKSTWRPSGEPRKADASGRLVARRVLAMAESAAGVLGLVDGDPERAWFWIPADTLPPSEVFGAWEPGPRLATPQQGGALVRLHDGNLVLTGGLSEGHGLRSAQLFDAATRTWRELPNMATRRFGHAVVVLGGDRVLVVGSCEPSPSGHGYDEVASRSVEVLEPGALRWQTLPPMPVGRCGAVAVATMP